MRPSSNLVAVMNKKADSPTAFFKSLMHLYLGFAGNDDRASGALRRVYSRLQYFFLSARSWFVLLTLKSTDVFEKK